MKFVGVIFHHGNPVSKHSFSSSNGSYAIKENYRVLSTKKLISTYAHTARALALWVLLNRSLYWRPVSAVGTMASSKLALLRNALRPAAVSSGAARGLLSRRFSAVASDEQDSTSSSSSSEPLISEPNEGLVFAKLKNIGRNALKTDIVHYLEGCELTVDDIKVEYNEFYNPVGMLVQFPSRSSFDTAFRQITRKGRLYNLSKISRSEWDLQMNYGGKTVFLRPPRNAILEDIERLFSGCNHDASGTEIVTKRGTNGPPLKMALVRFPTRTTAMTAVRLKNRSFCLNTPVVMHVLE